MPEDRRAPGRARRLEEAVPDWLFALRHPGAAATLAVLAPTALALIVYAFGPSSDLRLGPVFVLPFVVVAVLSSWWAAGVSAALVVVSYWYLVVPPGRSFAVRSGAAGIGLVALALMLAAMTVLARRLQRSVAEVERIDLAQVQAIELAQAQATETAALLALSASLSEGRSLVQVAQAALGSELLPGPSLAGEVGLVRSGGIEMLATRGLSAGVLRTLERVDIRQHPWLAPLAQGQPVCVDDALAFGRQFPDDNATRLFSGGSFFILPLRIGVERGLLSIHYADPRSLTDRRAYLSLCGEILSSALERAIERNRLEASFAERDRIARTLSTALLPPKLPAVTGFSTAAWLRPASPDQVAGDFYDLFLHPGGGWVAVIGDVCGKGAEAAAVTSLARYAARTAALADPDPAHVAATANEALLYDDSELFCTMAVAHWSPGRDGLRVALAGHHALRRIRAGTVDHLGRPSPPLGLYPLEIEVTRHELDPGDDLVLFTDGLVERSADFDDRALDRLLASLPGGDASGLVGRLRREVETLEAAHPDDIALMVICRSDPG